MTENGILRFGAMCQIQSYVGNVWITPTALKAIFKWLLRFGCFQSGEIIVDEQKIEAAKQANKPEPAPLSIDEILAATDTSTREGTAKLRTAVELEWLNELRPLIEQWVAHLQTDYGFTPSDEDMQFLFLSNGLFAQRGWGFKADTLNAARRYMVESGRWNSNLLSTQDVLDEQYARDGDYAAYQFNLRKHAAKLNRPRAEVGI